MLLHYVAVVDVLLYFGVASLLLHFAVVADVLLQCFVAVAAVGSRDEIGCRSLGCETDAHVLPILKELVLLLLLRAGGASVRRSGLKMVS